MRTAATIFAFILVFSVAMALAGTTPVMIASTSDTPTRHAATRTVASTKPGTSRTRKTVARRHSTTGHTTAKTRGPSFGDPTAGDDPSGEDPIVRQAAIESMDGLLGSMVAVDPKSGRILTIVNQKLAFAGGYQPCSTFKPAVALAALQEGVISGESSRMRLGKRWYLDLQQSIAHSNNFYFAKLGTLLGLGTMRKYAEYFGFAEPAGWGIAKEQPGKFPEEPPPASDGGVGKVASFGQGISQTLFQQASFVSAVSNGGTLYYLQYPKSVEDIENFQPRIKRQLEIGPWLKPLREGMLGAVEFGTARRAHQPDFSILGKTGTCSENGMKLGWFAGFSEQPGGLAVAVLQRTPQPMGGGPHAAQIAGHFFRKLADQNYSFKFPVKRIPTAALPASVQLMR
jgi:penicillin-binding protein 2